MRAGELYTGLRCMITNEQREFFQLLKNQGSAERHELEARQQHLAETMTKLGLINRIYNEETKSVIYQLFQR
jgi:hypothetical protein